MRTNFTNDRERRIGAWLEKDGAHFRIWAPNAKRVEVTVGERSFPLEKVDRGYFEVVSRDVKDGDRYFVRLDGKDPIPDPASRYQPEGPHGPSEVVTRDFPWRDTNWKGVPFNEWVIYELHVGTFTPEGTFDGIAKKIPHLKKLGVNAIEIMPIAQFAGKRNWGYDGVGLFAAQNNYGGSDRSPIALKKLVDECHANGIAVMLDVVYNHLGPEGNYLSHYGPYFQSKYKTPWGDALNYDGDWCDEVRRYFLENARQWLDEFHIDGLRLDAVHAILDTSARPFLEELTEMKRDLENKLNRPLLLIAESEANDARILRSPEAGGLGLDGQWADDLHHVVHTLLTGEKQGYYSDYGQVEQLAKIYKDGLLYVGEYSPMRHRSHGRPFTGIDRSRLVVCSQNHDQIGNRAEGERLLSLVGPEKARLAAACVFLSPGLPLMYMGEEFGETAPFQYFIDHTDEDLREAVRKGRREEFAEAFAKASLGNNKVPDPAAKETFENSKLQWQKLAGAESWLQYYTRLIALSKWIRRTRLFEDGHVQTKLLAEGRVLEVTGHSHGESIQLFFSFSGQPEKVMPDRATSKLEIVLNSSEDKVFPVTVGDSLELKPYSALALATWSPR